MILYEEKGDTFVTFVNCKWRTEFAEYSAFPTFEDNFKKEQIFSEETFHAKAINMLIKSMQVRIVHLVLALREIYIYEI